MAGKRNVFSGSADLDLVHVDDLRVACGSGAQGFLDAAIGFDDLFGLLDGRGLALNVREDGIDLRSFAHDLGFKAADEAVSCYKRQVLVEFDVKLDVEFALMRLDAEIVRRQRCSARRRRARGRRCCRRAPGEVRCG